MRGASRPTQDQAATPIRQGRKFTARNQGPRNRKNSEKKLVEKELRDGAREKSLAHVVIENLPLSRATALHSVALRAASAHGKEKPEDLTD